MAAAEVAPIVKIGGLADVVGSLPADLKKMNCDVRIVIPLYGSIDRKKAGLKKIYSNIEIPSGNNDDSDYQCEKVNIWEGELKPGRIKIYFIENKKYFQGDVYGDGNNKKFLFFSQALLYSLPIIKFQPDIIHAHDYHAAMLPLLLKITAYEYFKNTKTILTIHNLQFQGKEDVASLKIADLESHYAKSLARDAQDGKINFLEQGIVHADFLNTVSKTYAQEILTKKYGAGLEKVLQKNQKKLKGIVNGIDVDFFGPVKDKMIFKNFSLKNIKNKLDNKIALQRLVGLPQNKKTPVIGLVSRLTKQKGIDLLTEDFMRLDCQFVFLGTGQKEQEEILLNLEKKYPEKVSAKIMFDVKLAQQIYAGSDMFLMPSAFEPCGLGQLIAMRYGTVPIVRSTGGLSDTVGDYSIKNKKVNIASQRGFAFEKLNSKDLYNVLQLAIDLYQDQPQKWQKIIKNCMTSDFSWKKSAAEYIAMYKLVLD